MADITKRKEISGTTGNENIDARLYVYIESTISTNTSWVKISLQYKRNNTGFTTTGTGTFTIKHSNTTQNTATKTLTITEDAWVTAHSMSFTVNHGTDGTYPDIPVSASGSIPGTTLTSTSVSGTISFPTIPRASTIDSLSCNTSYFTGTMTYKYTPKYASFYTRCNISLNLDGEYIAVKSINLGQKAASQQTATVTLAESELSTIYNKLPKATKGTLRFTMRTYSDSGYSTQVGDAPYKELTLTIPNTTATQPTVTMTLSPVNGFTSSSAIYVKGLSKVKATFTNGAGKYGATIASYKLTVEGEDYASPYTSGYLTGTGSISVKGTVTDSRGYSRSYSQNITVLDYTKPTLDSLTCSTSYFNGTITHKYTPPNNSFYTRCVVTLGSTTVKTETHSRASGQQTVSFSFTESDLSKIYNALPSGTKGTLKFAFQAYTDSGYSNKIGEDSSKEITLSIPDIDATKPTATMTLTPVSNLGSPFASLYIQGKSKVAATLTNGAGKYGATIKSYEISFGGKNYDAPYTSEYLSSSGSVTVKGIVTDSRGFSRTYTQNITVVGYSVPKLYPVSGESEVIAARCDSGGNIVDNGTYLIIKAKRSYSKVSTNLCLIKYRYKAIGGSYSSWVTILDTSASSDEIVTGALLGTLDVKTSYLVQVQAVDTVGETATVNISVATERVYWHRAGSINSFGIGEYVSESNLVSIAEDIRLQAKGGFVPLELPEFTDFNTLTKPNKYYARYTYVPGYVNCPITVATTFALEVISMGRDGQVLQRLTRCSADATVYERQYYSSTWQEWEIVNPPMVVGEEYRTTERYMGKPVYTKLIYCEELPNTTYKTFEHGADAKQVIRCVGQMSDGNSIPFRFNATNFVEIYAGPQYVVIYAGNDKTNRSAYAQMWYIKD